MPLQALEQPVGAAHRRDRGLVVVMEGDHADEGAGVVSPSPFLGAAPGTVDFVEGEDAAHGVGSGCHRVG